MKKFDRKPLHSFKVFVKCSVSLHESFKIPLKFVRFYIPQVHTLFFDILANRGFFCSIKNGLIFNWMPIFCRNPRNIFMRISRKLVRIFISVTL